MTGSAYYTATHFAINTDVSNLISSHLPWRKRELNYQAEFPQQANSILVVVTAPTPELVDAAAQKLTDALSAQHSLFRSVQEEGSGKFFELNGLLYASTSELAPRMQRLRDAAPLIRSMATDPSLRGLAHALTFAIRGAGADAHGLAAAAPALNMIADALEATESGTQRRSPGKHLWGARHLNRKTLDALSMFGRCSTIAPLNPVKWQQPRFAR